MMKKFAFVLAATIGLLAGARAQADPVVAIDGVNGGFRLISPGAGPSNQATITFASSFVTQLNHELIGFDPTYIVSVHINTIGSAVTGGTQYLFNPTSYLGGEQILFPDGLATFNLVGATAFVPDLHPDTMSLSGTLQLVSNTSSEDLTPFLDPNSTFVFTLNSKVTVNNHVVDFNHLIASSAYNPAERKQTGSASFSEADPSVVPEPSSLMLLGLGSLSMVGYVYRRRSRLALA